METAVSHTRNPQLPRRPYYSRRSQVIGWAAVFLLVNLIFYIAYGAPAYAPLVIAMRLSEVQPGMEEPDVWRTLRVHPRLSEGSGPRGNYRISYRLPFGFGLRAHWDRTTQPSRLQRIWLAIPWE